MFGDPPSGPGSDVFGRTPLATSCWLAGVKGAESLRLVGLTLPVQQLIQYLRMGGGGGENMGRECHEHKGKEKKVPWKKKLRGKRKLKFLNSHAQLQFLVTPF